MVSLLSAQVPIDINCYLLYNSFATVLLFEFTSNSNEVYVNQINYYIGKDISYLFYKGKRMFSQCN